MNREQFISYLTHPEKLNAKSIEELSTLVNDFPYFQSARILHTLNLFKEDNIRYDAELKTTAIYAGDRGILKKHIDRMAAIKAEAVIEPENTPPVADQEEASPAANQAETKIQAKETPHIEYEVPETKTSNNNATEGEKSTEEDTIAQLKKIIEQRIREIEAEKKQKGEAQKTKPLSKKSKLNIIDEFIHNQPSISRSKSKFYDPVNKAKESIVEQEDIVSETLASIYMDQGHYQKAINMYKKLILNIPEKSSYFAALIKKAEKALKNKN